MSPHRDLTITEEELLHRLAWSVRFRWYASIATNVALLVAWYRFGVRFPLPQTALVALAVPFYNAIFALIVANLSAREAITALRIKIVANAQVACDIVAVATLVHFTGGIENPFMVFMLFPIVYSLPLLRRKTVLYHTTLAAFLVNAVYWGECFEMLPHVHLPTVVSPVLYMSRLYVFQTSFMMTVTLYLLLFVGGSVASTLRRRERELQATYNELRDLHEARAFYVRKVSHELRAPLGAIRSLLQVMLQGLMGPLSTQQEETLARVDRRAEGLLDLVTDLLTFAHLEVLRRPQQRSPVAMHDLVASVARLFAPQAEERGVSFQISTVPATVDGNREDLQQLVTNLVSNALRYTPRGGHVWVTGVIHGDRLALSVRDTGIGIPKDKLPNVFDEFFRASNARQLVPEGSGMGMAISRRIAEMHGGQIAVVSEEGKGASFTVELPLARSSDGTAIL
ncbi:HAMP domain-containing histidine kinase [Candidatus Fermentibacteria bacterium]|nr:HAMP domain-containing histidine kinase [Candidatus Fermentibacteria bacterium]